MRVDDPELAAKCLTLWEPSEPDTAQLHTSGFYTIQACKFGRDGVQFAIFQGAVTQLVELECSGWLKRDSCLEINRVGVLHLCDPDGAAHFATAVLQLWVIFEDVNPSDHKI
jgi:hypothetical protein